MERDFRKIQDCEFSDVVDLLYDAFPIPRDHIEDDLREMRANPRQNGDLYGLFEGKKLIATATYGACFGNLSSQEDSDDADTLWDGEGCLRYLAVDANHRREGIASWIVDKVIEDLKETVECPCVALNAIEGNEWLIRFWESRGFVVFGPLITDDYGTHRSYVLWFDKDE